MIRIAASARRDLDEGYDFYESQEIGLGDYFLSSVKADIESLKVSGGVHRNRARGLSPPAMQNLPVRSLLHQTGSGDHDIRGD